MHNYTYYTDLEIILGTLQARSHNGQALAMIREKVPELHYVLTWDNDPAGQRFEAMREIIRLLIAAPTFNKPLQLTDRLKNRNTTFKVIDGFPILEPYYKYASESVFRRWKTADYLCNLVDYLGLEDDTPS